MVGHDQTKSPGTDAPAGQGESLTTATEGPTFRDELVAAGILVPTASDGIYGRSGLYEDIVAGIEGLVAAHSRPTGATSYRFPPVMPRSVLEQSGYLSSFPDMIGSVSIFRGTTRGSQAAEGSGPVGRRLDVFPRSGPREPVPRSVPSPLSNLAWHFARWWSPLRRVGLVLPA